MIRSIYNYYRKYIAKFAEIAAPLNNLNRKNVKFVWTNECQKSFEILKNSLSKPPILQYPDFSEDNEFHIHTDASGVAVAAVLSNRNNLPIAYASRGLNKAEVRYSTIEKELLAIVWAVKYFRPYLFGRHFKNFTDHKPLLYLFSLNNPSSRLTKFRLCLEEYDFDVEYVRGKENVSADALSRITLTSDELKQMNNNVLQVMTRAQEREIGKNECSANQVGDDEISRKFWPDHPKIVEILKKPKDCTELVIESKENLQTIRKLDHVSTKFESLLYVPSLGKIYINPETRLTLSRVELLRDSETLCKKLNIPEIIIIRNEKSPYFIKEIGKIIKDSSIETGSCSINPKLSCSSSLRLCIVKGTQRVDDNETKKVILNDYHLLPSSGHAGINRMLQNIKKRYFWPGMSKDVSNFVTKCDSCQRYKHSKHVKEPMVITSTATTSFQKIYLDIVGPLQKDALDNKYILTLQCELTKFIEAYPLKSKEADVVSKAFVENFVLRYGIPLEIASDCGTEFVNSTMANVAKLLKINQIKSTPYHHESIGALENTHKSLNVYLRTLVVQEKLSWSTWVQFWCFAFNTTVHTETKYTPYELVFGKLCTLPSNLISHHVDPLYNFEDYALELRYRLQRVHIDAQNNLIAGKANRKLAHDKTINPVKYKTGDLVLIKSETGNKLSAVYDSPYEVLKDESPNVRIAKNGKGYVLHKNRTKPYVKGSS